MKRGRPLNGPEVWSRDAQTESASITVVEWPWRRQAGTQIPKNGLRLSVYNASETGISITEVIAEV
jgi:hypothetical protein